MTKIFREDTQWAIAGKVATAALERLARRLPPELQGEGSKIVTGAQGFAALLVFGGGPDETLAKQLLAAASPVYLLDFDDEAPSIVQLDRKRRRRVSGDPADFLD